MGADKWVPGMTVCSFDHRPRGSNVYPLIEPAQFTNLAESAFVVAEIKGEFRLCHSLALRLGEVSSEQNYPCYGQRSEEITQS